MTMAKTKSIHWRLVLDLSMIPPLGAATLKVSGWGAHQSFPWPRAAERSESCCEMPEKSGWPKKPISLL